MDNDVSAGNTSTSALGHLALGLTLLAVGIGRTGVDARVPAHAAERPRTHNAWVRGRPPPGAALRPGTGVTTRR